MAYVTKENPKRYIELGNYLVDFTDGDVMLFDNVKDFTPLYPLKPQSTLIAFCSKGSQHFLANGRNIELTKGKVMVCPNTIKLVPASQTANFECKVLTISNHITRALLRDKVETWYDNESTDQVRMLNLPDMDKDEFTFYFSLIRLKLRQPPHEIVLALLRALLLELCNTSEHSTSISRSHRMSQGKLLFNRFLSLISNSSIKRQPISTYASQLAITPKYLTMLCLKYSNRTASEWVAQYTVEEIRFYLKSTDLSIKEISNRMGFSNMSHFGSYVRKHLGISPSEYRYSKKS